MEVVAYSPPSGINSFRAKESFNEISLAPKGLAIPILVIDEDRLEEGATEFAIPEKIYSEMGDRNFFLQIGLTEEGGLNQGSEGYARIVCSFQPRTREMPREFQPTGKKLVPFNKPKEPKPLGVHAYFREPNAIATVSAFAFGGDIAIKQYLVRPVGFRRVQLKCQPVWNGKENDVPQILDHYDDAIDAAVRKANCLDCRDIHYARP